MLVSIIIPVYNVETYVERCIRSIMEQDHGEIELEIIAINDGSTDKSYSVLKILEKEFSILKVLDQENQGLGSTRNRGIQEAKGKYLWFVDSDDFVADDCLAHIFEILHRKGPDILAMDFSCTNENGEPIKWIDFKLNFKGKTTLDGPEFYALNYANSYIWLYLIKKTLFTENNLHFKPRINMQDSELMPRLLEHVQNISFFDKEVYRYVKRHDSFINNNDEKVRTKYYLSIIEVGFHLRQFKTELAEWSLIRKALEKKLLDINKILFLQFLYTNFNGQNLNIIMENLISKDFFPFGKIHEINWRKKIIYYLLKPLINVAPLSFRKMFLNLKARVQ